MRRINTLLVFFLLFFAALSAAGWAFLQSRSFGRLLSRAITEVSEKKFDTKVRFSRINMRFFPPGLGLENVTLLYSRQGTIVEAEAGEIGVLFDLNMFSEAKVNLAEVFLSEGFVDLTLPNQEKSEQHPWDRTQHELEKLPVKISRLRVEDSRLSFLGTTLDVKSLSVSPDAKVIGMEAELKLLRHESMPSSIDMLKVSGEIFREKINAKQILLFQKSSKIQVSGQVQSWSDFERLSFDGLVEADVYLPDVHEWGDLSPVKLTNGVLKTKGKFSWTKAAGAKAVADIELGDFQSNIFQAQRLTAKISTKDIGLYLSDLSFTNNDEKISIKESVKVWDYDKQRLLPDGVRAQLVNVELGNVLSFLGDSLEPLKGRLSGDVAVRLRGSDLYLSPFNGFMVNNLRLVFPSSDGGSTQIINAPSLWLHDSEFMVANGTFVMKSTVKAPKSQLELEGFVSKDEVSFDVKPGNIRIEDLGNVAGLDLKGEGTNRVQVKGPLDHTVITIDGGFRDFEILGYRLGETVHKIVIDLKEGSVEIPGLKAKKGRYEYAGSGVVNYNNFLMDLSIDLPLISFSELKEAIFPLQGGLSFLPEDFEAMLQGNVELYAKADIANLRVGADVYAQKILAGGEGFKDAKFTFLYGNRKINVKDFSTTKEEGKIVGSFGYDLDLSRLDYQLTLRNLTSSEITLYKRSPLSLSFRAVGEFQGYHSDKRWRHRGFLGMTQSRVHDKIVPDSTFEWEVRDDSVFIDARIADDWVLLSANSVQERGQTVVDSDLAINIPDLPLFMRGLLGENPQLVNATGELALTSKLKLRDWKWGKISARTWLKNLSLNSPEISLNQKFTSPQVVITDGEVKNWNFNINVPDFKLTSSAQGGLSDKLVVKNDLTFDAKYLEVLSKHIQRAEGRVSSELKWILSNQGPELEVSSSAKELAISTDLLPFSLNNIQYAVTFKKSELEIESFSFSPDAGRINATGTVLLNGLNPDVNLRYTLERATIPFKTKSSVTVSGDGLIFGARPPYLLRGDLVVNAGSVLNEINDFANTNAASADTKYLPKDAESVLSGFVNLDLNVRTENPISVNNSMMDLNLVADLQLSGDLLRPSADGKVQTSGTQSKVFFKNSEYQINKAELLFNGRKPITKPDFDVAASSTIANYKVTAKAFGTPENFTFDLSSDPGLSKQNILSLIAFGYTDDLSNSISAEERQNLTNVGVGSFIFDQFKVTDIVKKQFGLQVNLGTVFVQSDESMLLGRSGDQGGASALARTRTATNIEVKKRLSEAMSLSVSSTVGGSIGQRQRMNINYGISKSVQLEGVYELRTNAEGTEDVIDNSIGGDIKFRMTFK